MAGGDDKKQDGSIPGTSGRTATTQVGQTLEIIQKRSCPLYSGEKYGISIESWVQAVTKHLDSKQISSESAKVAEALSLIDHTKGDAHYMVQSIKYESLTELFNSLRIWATNARPQIHANFENLFSIVYNPSKESFLCFTRRLLLAFDRIQELGFNSPDQKQIFLNFIESRVVMGLPDKTREKFLKEEFKVKTREELEPFFQNVYIELNKKDKISSSINLVTRKQDKNKSGNNTRALPWERRTGRCSRCAQKGHIKFNCKESTPKCTLCKANDHEFITCPENFRNKKIVDSNENKNASNSFLGQQ